MNLNFSNLNYTNAKDLAMSQIEQVPYEIKLIKYKFLFIENIVNFLLVLILINTVLLFVRNKYELQTSIYSLFTSLFIIIIQYIITEKIIYMVFMLPVICMHLVLITKKIEKINFKELFRDK